MFLYDSLSRKKHEFKPLSEEVKIYVCGITAYDHPHLGHGRSAVVFDVLRRHLETKGYKTKFVRNFTDIDDRIIDRLGKNGEPSDLFEFGEKYTTSYTESMGALNNLEPHITPYATKEISQMIDIISTLIDKGFAYESKGSVYFRVKNFASYGKLSGRSLDSLLLGEENGLEDDKENKVDFVLWKAYKNGEPFWESPWGKGRPGWHIECSAMVHRYLGEGIDIHGGGNDLIFPHHENELAQSETAFFGSKMANFWVHNGMLVLAKGEKMSKSLKNSTYVKDVLKTYSADAVRLWFLQGHYRSPLHLEKESIQNTEKAVYKLREAAYAKTNNNDLCDESALSSLKTRFTKALDDDLNTPSAVAAMFELRKRITKGLEEDKNVGALQKLMFEFASVLGLKLKKIDLETSRSTDEGSITKDQVLSLIQIRKEAKDRRDFKEADRIRGVLNAQGVELRDKDDGGVSWRYI